MPSSIAWLDASAEQQRRVREIVALFAQPDSRDELGIGQIRDVYSDLLFPGTSVIQTRAKYFLFVPWLFTAGEERGLTGPRLLEWVQRLERRLIEALRARKEVEGLIGRVAGPAVKILPSTIYWSGLERLGILTRPVPIDQVGAHQPATCEVEELDERRVGTWHPTLPTAHPGLPDDVPGGFSLSALEAAWLRERVMDRAPGTLFAHLVAGAALPDELTDGPWDDPACRGAPGGVREVLEEARLFSLAIHGASLLYNLLVAETYEAAGLTRITAPVDTYRDALTAWADDVAGSAEALSSWDRDRFWVRVLAGNPLVRPPTRLFVDAWLDRVSAGSLDGLAEDEWARQLVADRERFQKRRQARLANDRLLRTWSGESGAARLTFRWRQVRRIVTDMLEPAGESVARP